MKILNKKSVVRIINENKNHVANISFNNDKDEINVIAIIPLEYFNDNFHTDNAWLKKIWSDIEESFEIDFENKKVNYMIYANSEIEKEKLLQWAKENNIR